MKKIKTSPNYIIIKGKKSNKLIFKEDIDKTLKYDITNYYSVNDLIKLKWSKVMILHYKMLKKINLIYEKIYIGKWKFKEFFLKDRVHEIMETEDWKKDCEIIQQNAIINDINNEIFKDYCLYIEDKHFTFDEYKKEIKIINTSDYTTKQKNKLIKLIGKNTTFNEKKV